MFKLIGELTVKNDTVQVSEKFSKREFVIKDTGSMYPQDILFQLTQDNCKQLDYHKVGDPITVSFNLRGREWTSPQGEVRYFNTLDAWRIEKYIGDGGAPAMQQNPNFEHEKPIEGVEEPDDMPF